MPRPEAASGLQDRNPHNLTTDSRKKAWLEGDYAERTLSVGYYALGGSGGLRPLVAVEVSSVQSGRARVPASVLESAWRV